MYRRQGSRPSPWEKKCKKAKWLSEEALQIAVKIETKSKGEKERYTHLNAEFQRIARRDKKAFLSNQCKELEENNRRGKTRDLFKELDMVECLKNYEQKFINTVLEVVIKTILKKKKCKKAK